MTDLARVYLQPLLDMGPNNAAVFTDLRPEDIDRCPWMIMSSRPFQDPALSELLPLTKDMLIHAQKPRSDKRRIRIGYTGPLCSLGTYSFAEVYVYVI